MSKKRLKRRRRTRPQQPAARPRVLSGGIHLTTPEGDKIVLTSAHYRHAAMEDILSVLQQADDFGLEDDLEPESDAEARAAGPIDFPWYETRSGAPKPFAPIGRRVLANLTLTPTTLEVQAMSQRRLDDCHRRLGQLLGERIQRVRTQAKDVDRALRERKPRAALQEPAMPPPEVIAELEEQMLRQWIDDSIPALGGLTPREAVKTPEGRRQVLELIEHSVQLQTMMPKTPGTFAPDYRKVKKMLGLE
jgi:hypothetical protein